MVLKKTWDKHQNFILALVWILLLVLAVSIRYDFYYDLNDDVLMKDILAGVYTGVPEGHNIQMLYLISAFISIGYRILRDLPWYGIFLCVCQFGSLFLIGRRSLTYCQSLWIKLGLLLLGTLLTGATLLPHLVYAQYTITATLLASAAAFLFYTADQTGTPLCYLRRNLPSILMVTVAYLIRSEMLLLVLPLICVAGVLRWSTEQKIFCKESFLKYLGVFGAILLGLLVGQGTHMLAYSAEEWKTFTTYFDNRTELYDFQILPEYEANQEFYESIGLNQSEQELLQNYNFGLDEEIDETLLGEIASYAADHRKAEQPFMDNLKESMGNYGYRLLHGSGQTVTAVWDAPDTDFPWNYLVISAYLSVVLLFLLQRKWWRIWEPAFLFLTRTTLWMYILMRRRYPTRITHSLYLMEFCILAAILLQGIGSSKWQKKNTAERKKQFGIAALALLAGLSLWGCTYTVRTVDLEQTRREQEGAPYEALLAYCQDHPEQYYFIDVYSTVSYSEKMFAGVDNELANHDIMGGWACKSPLYRKKLAAFQLSTMEEAILYNSNVYVIAENENSMQWLQQYYTDHDADITISPVDTIGDAMTVYQVVEN